MDASRSLGATGLMLLVLVAASLLAQEAAVRPAGAVSRPASPAGTDVEVRLDLLYGTGGGRPLPLDLYLPKAPLPRAAAILFIHGGGWEFGKKESWSETALRFARKGYVTATIEYRLSSEAIWPAAIEDSKCAVRWLRSQAKALGFPADCIVACGDSAGGHLSALLGTTGDDFHPGTGGHPGVSSAVQAVVMFNGPALLDDAALLRNPITRRWVYKFLGGPPRRLPSTFREASPLTHVNGHSRPFLLLHGTADFMAPISQSRMLSEALARVGVPHTLQEYEGASHEFYQRPQYYEQTMATMAQWLQANLPCALARP